MTENTWPDPDRPGVPPENGPYWLQCKSVGDMNPCNYEEGKWFCIGTALTLSSERVAAFYNYFGPCLTPEEIAAKATRIAELERLLKRADDIANWTGEDLICGGRSYASVVQAYKNDRAALGGKDE